MRAVVFEGKDKVGVHDVDEPRITAATSAIVEVDQTSICGSDLHFYWGEFAAADGIRPGHEFVGTIVDVGAGVSRMHVGDRVMATALYGCGHCPGCASLQPTQCREGWVNFGTTLDVPGGQAQFAGIPNADHVLQKVPGWMSTDQAILMTDVLPTGAYGARNASITPGSTVLVVGLGPIGLSSVANALTYGPARVLAVDGIASRRARAAGLGAQVLDPADGPIDQQVRDLTQGVGADSVIEAVGNAHTLAASIQSARTGGTVAVLGILTDSTIPVHPLAVTPKNLTLRFSTTDVPLMWKHLFPLVEQGSLQLGDVFTHRLPLTGAVRGYEVFANRQEDVFKVVFDAQA